MHHRPKLVEVAVALPLCGTYHYLLPPSLATTISPGMRVVVPFGARRVTGYVLGFPERAAVPEERLREVADLLDEAPLLSAELLGLLDLAARYYVQPLGELARAALPAGINVSGRRTVRLRRAPQTDPSLVAGLDRARPMLALLARIGAKPRPCTRVMREAGSGCRVRDLLELKRLGLVELDFALRRPRVSVRTLTLLSIAGTVIGPKVSLGVRQREVLELIARRDRVSTAELFEQLPSSRDALRRLIDRSLVRTEEIEELRDPFLRDPVEPDRPLTLTQGQAASLAEISKALSHGSFAAFLLHGETGSGKTEIYLQAIEQVRARGGTALVMVPEISLTPQLSGRFRARFGDEEVAVLHSGLSEGERYDQWRRIRSGKVGIVVGARSAVFAPLDRPEIVVVDEEHDPSYHQTEVPRYDGRSLALLRAKRNNAVVVLGSATPSMESYHNALSGRYRLLNLRGRPTGARLPVVELVDLRRAKLSEASPLFSDTLCQALKETVSAREQAILFLNRRGYAPVVICPGCGDAVFCPHCSVSLCYHRRQELLRCHYCDHAQRPPTRCPSCERPGLTLLGQGTEKVESAVRKILPAARVLRLDRDTASGRGTESILRSMRERRADVLVGTQMVTKGHDFHGVTLVGVLLADLGLRLPDFRASERSFQLLTQVAGRAGRGTLPGRVIIQTYVPDHHAITAARSHDYLAFNRVERVLRREFVFPPFVHLIAVHVDGEDAARSEQAARSLGRQLGGLLLAPGGPRLSLLGPAPAPIEQLRGRYRWQLLLKGVSRAELRSVLPRLQQAMEEISRGGVRAAIEVDPISML